MYSQYSDIFFSQIDVFHFFRTFILAITHLSKLGRSLEKVEGCDTVYHKGFLDSLVIF